VERVGFEPEIFLILVCSANLLSPGQPADISVRSVLKLFFSCAIGSSMGLGYLLLLSVPTLSVILFSSQILKGSDHGIEHLQSLGFWTLNTRKHNVSGEKTEIQLDSFSETLCFLVP
jgi:hypothetical protein